MMGNLRREFCQPLVQGFSNHGWKNELSELQAVLFTVQMWGCILAFLGMCGAWSLLNKLVYGYRSANLSTTLEYNPLHVFLLHASL